MTSGMNFWDVPVWSFVVTMTILFAAMMIANTLRNLIKPLRKLMIPSAVLGGFIVLLADFFWKKLTGSSMFASSTLETLTYHGLGLGFVAMSLRSVEKTRKIICAGARLTPACWWWQPICFRAYSGS